MQVETKREKTPKNGELRKCGALLRGSNGRKWASLFPASARYLSIATDRKSLNNRWRTFLSSQLWIAVRRYGRYSDRKSDRRSELGLSARGSQPTAFGHYFPKALGNESQVTLKSVATESQQNSSKSQIPGVEPRQAHHRYCLFMCFPYTCNCRLRDKLYGSQNLVWPLQKEISGKGAKAGSAVNI